MLFVQETVFSMAPGRTAVSNNTSVPPDILRDFEVLRQQYLKNPHDVPVINALGIIYARVQQTEQALMLWRQGITVDPTYIHFYNNIGSALKTQKRYDEARNVFISGLKVAPSYWIYYNLGLLDWEIGHWAEAARSFEAALLYNSEFEPAKRKLKEMGFPLPKGLPQNRLPSDASFAMEPKPPVSIAPFISELPDPLEYKVAIEEKPFAVKSKPVKSRVPESDNRVDIAQPATLTVDFLVDSIKRKIKDSEPKVIALTFDDGPHPTLTRQLLDYLKSENVSATFFVIGSRAEAYPDLLMRMKQERHEIANHGWTHKSLVSMGASRASSELERTAELVGALTGKIPVAVRPPFGHTSKSIESMIHQKGWHQIMWDADSRDWQDGNSTRIIRRIVRDFRQGGIILFHDIHSGCLRSLPVLIPALKKCGFRFVTITELIGIFQAAS
ncbi:MAG: polysaccharide deacetylase family protein [Candidatus Riflebacteria bacterium]|nr:polysaccharide deacetylase family protein [Candidatus Riflebacteria bacterium]